LQGLKVARSDQKAENISFRLVRRFVPLVPRYMLSTSLAQIALFGAALQACCFPSGESSHFLNERAAKTTQKSIVCPMPLHPYATSAFYSHGIYDKAHDLHDETK
jgi:hypothetical protein